MYYKKSTGNKRTSELLCIDFFCWMLMKGSWSLVVWSQLLETLQLQRYILTCIETFCCHFNADILILNVNQILWLHQFQLQASFLHIRMLQISPLEQEMLTCRPFFHLLAWEWTEQIGVLLLRPTWPAVQTSVTQIGPYDKRSDPTDETSGGQMLCVCVCVCVLCLNGHVSR